MRHTKFLVFVIKTDPPIDASKSYLVLINQKKNTTRQIPGPDKRTEEIMKHEDDCDSKQFWSPCYNREKPGKKTGWTGDQRKNGNHLDHGNAEISKNS